jgi:hypothetical protein
MDEALCVLRLRLAVGRGQDLSDNSREPQQRGQEAMGRCPCAQVPCLWTRQALHGAPKAVEASGSEADEELACRSRSQGNWMKSTKLPSLLQFKTIGYLAELWTCKLAVPFSSLPLYDEHFRVTQLTLTPSAVETNIVFF